jgi:hypothetical protein
MGVRVFRYTIESTVSGALNPAIVSLAFQDPGWTADESKIRATRGFVAIEAAAYWFGEAGQKLTACDYADRPGDTFLPQPLDVTTHATYKAHADFSALIPVQEAGFNAAFGPASGGSNGRGDSACINFRTTLGGRSGRGRIFLPYLTPSAIDTATGLLSATRTANVEALLTKALEAGAGHPINSDADQYVWSPLLGAGAPVTTRAVQRIPSRLRTRLR